MGVKATSSWIPFHTMSTVVSLLYYFRNVLVKHPIAINEYTGIETNARCTAYLLDNTTHLVIRNITAPSTPAMPGAMPQAANTLLTPCHPQCTFLMPTDAVPAPTRPPMIECVVLTGSPNLVARIKKIDEPIIAHIIVSIRTAGSTS